MALLLSDLRKDTDNMVKMGSIGGFDTKIDREQLLAAKPTIDFASKEFELASTLDS